MELTLTNKNLTTVAKAVNFKSPEKNLKLAEKLYAVMETRGGCGISATQCGLTDRVFVMVTNNYLRYCFNPRITSTSELKAKVKEGCLSFPGDICEVDRYVSVRVEYFNYKGERRAEVLTGMDAICFQHELDHLNGITMHDRARREDDTAKSRD